MNLLSLLTLATWLSLAQARSAGDVDYTCEQPLLSRSLLLNERQSLVPEEREIISREQIDEYLKSKDDMTSGIVDLGKNAATGIGTISQIDFSQSGGKIAWEVVSAVVPIIGSALALIPGVGVVVSGVFLGLWSVISPIFTPKKDNPVEKMVKELAEKMGKKIDEKLSNFIRLAVFGEIARNTYVCNKYADISNIYAKQLKNNVSLGPNEALDVKLFLNDCDNFLKDTAEAFVYDEYADVLWVPGAITTAARVAFLAEIINNEYSIGLRHNIVKTYYKELKNDIQRQFEYHAKGLKLINAQLKTKNNNYQKNTNYLEKASAVTNASCALQSQFFYFDRDIYPYGMPTIENSTDIFADIRMQRYYNWSREKSKMLGATVKHVQFFFNVSAANFAAQLPKREEAYVALEFMNCFLGPRHLTSPSTFWFNFYSMPYSQSYEFRVMYLESQTYDSVIDELGIPLLTEFDKNSQKFKDYMAVYNSRKIDKGDPRGLTCLNIEFVFSDHKNYNDSRKLIDVPSNAHWKKCPYEKSYSPACNNDIYMFSGRFKMYSAGVFNHMYEELSPLISIEDPTYRFGRVPYRGTKPFGFLVGMEIILRPYVS